MNLLVLFGRPPSMMDAVSATICDGGRANAVIFTIRIKPSELALAQLLRKRLPASDRPYPKIPRRRRGKRHHHGGDVCGLVVFGLTVLFVLFLL